MTDRPRPVAGKNIFVTKRTGSTLQRRRRRTSGRLAGRTPASVVNGTVLSRYIFVVLLFRIVYVGRGAWVAESRRRDRLLFERQATAACPHRQGGPVSVGHLDPRRGRRSARLEGRAAGRRSVRRVEAPSAPDRHPPHGIRRGGIRKGHRRGSVREAPRSRYRLKERPSTTREAAGLEPTVK